MIIYKSSSFEIRYNSQKELLNLYCYERTTSEDFQKGLENALQFAEQKKLKRWLIDVNEIGALGETEENCLQNYLYPHMMMQLGLQNYMAVVLSEGSYRQLLNEAGKYGLKTYNSFIIINTFCKKQEAVAWLDAAA